LKKEVKKLAKRKVPEELRVPVEDNSWLKLEQARDQFIDLTPFYGRKLKFGFVSDTHLCSKHQQITFLKTAYKIFDREKVQFVIHCGDLC